MAISRLADIISSCPLSFLQTFTAADASGSADDTMSLLNACAEELGDVDVRLGNAAAVGHVHSAAVAKLRASLATTRTDLAKAITEGDLART